MRNPMRQAPGDVRHARTHPRRHPRICTQASLLQECLRKPDGAWPLPAEVSQAHGASANLGDLCPCPEGPDVCSCSAGRPGGHLEEGV